MSLMLEKLTLIEIISKEDITGHIQSCPCNELQVMSEYHTHEQQCTFPT